MIDNDLALAAKADAALREKFISDNIDFILSSASRASGRWVDIHDDLYSEALISFNSAIDSFTEKRGNFAPYAEKLIRNRIIDCLRREQRSINEIPISTLSATDKDGEEIPFDIPDTSEDPTGVIFEIRGLERDLLPFDISFSELPEISPKTQKARKECRRAVKFIITERGVIDSVTKTKKLPTALLLRELDINKKMLERYRKYIIVGMLICTGDYPVLSEYFWG